MSSFNNKLGTRLNNLAMKTAAQDAKNDVFTTLLSLVAMVLACAYPQIPFDGIGGVILSIFLFYSAYGMAKEIISAILGNPIDLHMAKEIEDEILLESNIKGVHDLIVHDYGPNTHYGSAHCEMDSDMDFMKAHEIVDRVERNILEKYHVNMTLHMDPLEKDTERSLEFKKLINDSLHELDPKLSMHDLRIIPGKEHVNLFFDVVVPFSYKGKNDVIQESIEKAFVDEPYKIHLHINFEHGFVSERGDEDE